MSIHRAYYEQIPDQGAFLIDGEEAHHALRTKRLAEGDLLEILDGKGKVARVRIVATDRLRKGAWAMRVEIKSVAVHPPQHPHLAVFSGVPKGPRLDVLIEGLSQAGAARWSPLAVRRSVVDPRPTKLDRLGRVAIESGKQCGRAWTMSIGSRMTLPVVLSTEDSSNETQRAIVLADASGGTYEPSGATSIALVVGPEGGFEPSEIEAARAAGARIARFGPHIMRIETAATVATGVVLELERHQAPPSAPPVSIASSKKSASPQERITP
jgi:16S rRNA (uracil1498-N3)-methyltransferase